MHHYDILRSKLCPGRHAQLRMIATGCKSPALTVKRTWNQHFYALQNRNLRRIKSIVWKPLYFFDFAVIPIWHLGTARITPSNSLFRGVIQAVPDHRKAWIATSLTTKRDTTESYSSVSAIITHWLSKSYNRFTFSSFLSKLYRNRKPNKFRNT